VVLHERTPVAFLLRQQQHAVLDHSRTDPRPLTRPGVLQFSGVAVISEKDTLRIGAANRMGAFQARHSRNLDPAGAHYSADISEVTLAILEDLRAVTVMDGAFLLHLGSSHFMEHTRTYLRTFREWRAISENPSPLLIALRLYDRQSLGESRYRGQRRVIRILTW